MDNIDSIAINFTHIVILVFIASSSSSSLLSSSLSSLQLILLLLFAIVLSFTFCFIFRLYFCFILSVFLQHPHQFCTPLSPRASWRCVRTGLQMSLQCTVASPQNPADTTNKTACALRGDERWPGRFMSPSDGPLCRRIVRYSTGNKAHFMRPTNRPCRGQTSPSRRRAVTRCLNKFISAVDTTTTAGRVVHGGRTRDPATRRLGDPATR